MAAAAAQVRKSCSKGQMEATGPSPGQLFAALESMLSMQRHMETELALLAADQRAIALALHADSKRDANRAAVLEGDVAFSAVGHRSSAGSATTASVVPLGRGSLASSEPEGFHPKGCLSKLAEAEVCLGSHNILRPTEAKAFLDAHPTALFLDVSDGDAAAVPGAYKVPLGHLYFRASGDLPDFKDPVLTDRDRHDPVLVTCAMPGVAKLACKVLLDYGYSNVKLVEGGNVAWKSHTSAGPGSLPPNWPASVPRRHWFGREDAAAPRDFCHVPSMAVAVGASAKESQLQVFPSGHRSTPGLAPPADSRHCAASPVTSTAISEASGQHRRYSKKRKWSLVISPCSSLRIALDILSICILAFDLITVPWVLAWDVQIQGWLETTSFLVACFWSLDILVTFRTGFFLRGELHMNPSVIARRYLKSWFFPDICVVLLDWASQFFLFVGKEKEATDQSSMEVRALGILRFAKWSRLVRFFRMVRFMRFSDVTERILDCGYYSPRFYLVMQVAQILFIIFYLNHIFGCLLWGIGRLEGNTGGRWIDLPVDSADFTYNEADPLFQYTASLQSAMTQILAGSMMASPTNSVEHIVSVVCLITGVLFLSSLVSALAAKMTQMRMLQQDKSQKLAELREFLRRKAIGKEMGVNILKQVDASLKEQRPEAMENLMAFASISQRHRTELHRELCTPHLLQQPLFALLAHMDCRIVRQLCDAALRLVVQEQEDVVFSPGDAAHDCYCVVSGALRYTQEPETSLVICDVSQAVHRGQWVSEAALWTQWTHVGMLEATEPSELLVLHAQTFFEVLQRNPHASHLAAEYSLAYHRRLGAASPPYGDWPSDVSVPFASFPEVMSCTSGSLRLYVANLLLNGRAGHSWSCQQLRMLEDVETGRCALLPSVSAASCDVELVSFLVQLRLERPDGRLLAQLGTWEDDAALPSLQLPSYGLQCGELPRQALLRLLKTQLVLKEDALRAEKCVSSVEPRADGACSAKAVVATHYASLEELAKWPHATRASAPLGRDREMIRRSTSWWESKSSGSVNSIPSSSLASNAAAPLPPPPASPAPRSEATREAGELAEEVFVIAGLPELTGCEDQDEAPEPILRLFAWLDPAQLEHLDSHLGHVSLRKFLAAVVVTEEVEIEAKRVFFEGQRKRQTL